jgi:hypothetical protein
MMGFFPAPPCPEQLWGLAILLFNGYGGRSFPPGSKVAEVKNVWSYTSTPPICPCSMVFN